VDIQGRVLLDPLVIFKDPLHQNQLLVHCLELSHPPQKNPPTPKKVVQPLRNVATPTGISQPHASLFPSREYRIKHKTLPRGCTQMRILGNVGPRGDTYIIQQENHRQNAEDQRLGESNHCNDRAQKHTHFSSTRKTFSLLFFSFSLL
jgi:hypothetical protein